MRPTRREHGLVPTRVRRDRALFLYVRSFRLRTLYHNAMVNGVTNLRVRNLGLVEMNSTRPMNSLAITPTKLRRHKGLLFVHFVRRSVNRCVPRVLVYLIQIGKGGLNVMDVTTIYPGRLLRLFFTLYPMSKVCRPNKRGLCNILPRLNSLVNIVLSVRNVTRNVSQNN